MAPSIGRTPDTDSRSPEETLCLCSHFGTHATSIYVVQKEMKVETKAANEPAPAPTPRSTAAPEPAPEVSASDVAYQHVRASILDGDLPGGAMLSEGAIANELGLSRTPVREGFLRLQAEGWLRLYPKRGALVLEVGPHELEEVVEARVLVETHAVSQVSEHERERAALVERLRAIVAAQRAAHERGDLTDFSHADADFHSTIVEAGGNGLLADFFGSLRDRQRRMTARSLWRRSDRTELVLAEHDALIECIERGDPGGFEAALTHHIRKTHRELLS